LIVKERTIPLKLEVYDALMRRITLKHPKRNIIQEELSKIKAGFKGEKAIDYYLQFLPQDNYYIFHDLRLKLYDYYFQIDTLIVTPSFLLILEIKNIAGTLHFEPMYHQLIRKINEKEEGFPDPLSQVRRHEKQLREWLISHKIPSIPIESLIIISFPSTIIHPPKYMTKLHQKICHAQHSIEKIEEISLLYRKSILRKKDINKMKRLLLKHHTPLINIPPCPFGIQKSDILHGVQCPYCQHIPMYRKHGGWVCQHCQSSTKDAHHKAVDDYFLLIDHELTNQKLCEFLQIQSSDTATRLLISMGLPYNGSNKGRIYYRKIK
jgi:hypothetical protein